MNKNNDKNNQAQVGEHTSRDLTPDGGETSICEKCEHKHWGEICGTFIKLNEQGTKFSFCPCNNR